MKTIILIITINLLAFKISSAQNLSDREKIKTTVNGLLDWYKKKQQDSLWRGRFELVKPQNTTVTHPYINWDGVEHYLYEFKNSGFVSDTYIQEFKHHFKTIDNELDKIRQADDAIVKIDGLDLDLVFHTFEPEMILDHFHKGIFDRIHIVYNKSIVRLKISKAVVLIFTLTKSQKQWMIDYIGFDNTYKYSLGNQ